MKLPRTLKTLALSMGAAALSGAVHATVLALPDSNPMATGTYNSFQVYSLDLLQQCATAGDPRCLPSGPFPVQSSPGQIADQAVVLTSSNGYGGNITSPFPTGSLVDNAFMTPTGNQGSSFAMTTSNEPGGSFTGDTAGRWDVSVSLLRGWLTSHNLVFLFDDNQSGSGPTQNIFVWAQARINDAGGNMISGGCFEVSTGAGGCTDTSTNPIPVASAYLPAVGDFCVDRITGAAYNIGSATNSNSCPSDATHTSGGYYVANNLGTNAAEFAAFNQQLNDMIKSGLYDNDFLSINVKYFGNDAGAEQLWICSECTIGSTRVPEPATLALLGLALAGIVVTQRRTRSR